MAVDLSKSEVQWTMMDALILLIRVSLPEESAKENFRKAKAYRQQTTSTRKGQDLLRSLY